jgi:aspartyl-tRNA(Asn)/glutamyl-tRNA(Gln) amidotransferase subunit B
LLSRRDYAELVYRAQAQADNKTAKKIANLLASSLNTDDDAAAVKLPELADLLELAGMLLAGKINSSAGDQILQKLLNGAKGAGVIAKKLDLVQNNNAGELKSLVQKVLDDPTAAKAVEDIQAGNEKAIGFLVGLVMKESKGKANPALAQKLIKELIKRPIDEN